MASSIMNLVGSEKYWNIFRDTLRFSKYYFQARTTIGRLENMDEEAIRAYQYLRLKTILADAYQNIPYYKESFARCDFNPCDFRRLEDIKLVPILTKEQIRENYERLVPERLPRRYLKMSTTGGSTGIPMTLYLDRRTSSHVDFAYQTYIWKEIGYRFRDRCIVMRGDTFDENDPALWKMNYPMNWLIMSSLRIRSDNASIYLEKIRRFDPKYLIVYPSNACILIKYLSESGGRLCASLKGVICSSETLYDWQRQYIESSLDVPVYSYYGLTEKCCLASGSLESSGYEFVPTYCFTELLNREGNDCSEDGEVGEIIATGMNSMSAHLIRYRTNDIGIHSITPLKDAHRGWKSVKRIMGRASEFLVDKGGSLITFTCSDEPFWSVMGKMVAYQYLQSIPGRILVNIEVSHPLTDEELKEVRRAIAAYYPQFEVELNSVANIPKTKIGKFRYLIQNIPISFST